MNYRTTLAVNFRTKLGLRQHDPVMTQEQSVLTKFVTVFAAEEIIMQYNIGAEMIKTKTGRLNLL